MLINVDDKQNDKKECKCGEGCSCNKGILRSISVDEYSFSIMENGMIKQPKIKANQIDEYISSLQKIKKIMLGE